MTNSIQKEIQVFIGEIVNQFNPERIILFGSHAYGNAKPDRICGTENLRLLFYNVLFFPIGQISSTNSTTSPRKRLKSWKEIDYELRIMY